MRPAAELDDLLQQQASGVISPAEFAACARTLYTRYAKFPVFGRDLGNAMYPEVIAGTVTSIETPPKDVRVDLNGVAVLLPAKWAGRGAIRVGDRLVVAVASAS